MGKGKSGCAAAMISPDPVAEGMASLGLPAVYEVGGAVRDRLMGREPKDRDFMVCAVGASELLEACRRAGGAQELTVSGQLVGVRLYAPFTGPEGVEVALARTERSTGPAHTDFEIVPLEPDAEIVGLPLSERAGHPSIEAQLREDLGRRDFTCNAIAEPLGGGELVDPLGGVKDIEEGVLRTISPEAFRDDPLRILRGLGRVSRDGLEPSAETSEQAARYANEIKTISAERIQGELMKILSGPNSSRALSLARDWGALQAAIPELEPMIGFEQKSRFHDLTVDEHTLKALSYADRLSLDPDLKLAVLMHDCAKPHTAKPKQGGGLMYHADPDFDGDPLRAMSHEAAGEEITRGALSRLRFSAASQQRVSSLVGGHMFAAERDFLERPPERQALLARRMLSRYGYERSRDLCLLRICDLAGKGEIREGFDRDARALMAALDRQRHQPTSISDLNIGGREIIEMGAEAGPRVGEVLEGLLKIVVGDPAQNDPEKIRLHARRAIERL